MYAAHAQEGEILESERELQHRTDEIVQHIIKDCEKNTVLILICRGSRRHAIAKKLELELANAMIQVTLFTYRKPEEIKQFGFRAVEPIERDIESTLVRMREVIRRGTKTILITASTLEAALFYEKTADDVELKPVLVFLPKYFKQHISKEYHRSFVKVDFSHIRTLGKAEGISGNYEGKQVNALKKLDPGALGFQDIIRNLPKELFRDAAGGAAGALLYFGATNYLFPTIGSLVEKLHEIPSLLGVNPLARSLSSYLKENMEKIGFNVGYVATEEGMVSFIEEITKRAKEPFLGSFGSLLSAARLASDYINDDRYESKMDEISSRWTLDIEAFRNFINNFCKTMKGQIADQQDIKSVSNKLDQFAEEIKKLTKTYQDLLESQSVRSQLQAIYSEPSDLGISIGEHSQISIAGKNYDLVTSGNFDATKKAIQHALSHKKSVLLRGPKGIGKSVLAKYALAEMLNDKINGSNKYIALVLPNTVGIALLDTITNSLDRLRINGSGKIHIIFYDPLLPILYAEPPPSYSAEEDLRKLNINFENLTWLCENQNENLPTLLVVSDDIWDVLDEKIRARMSKTFEEIMVNLNQTDFLKEIISAYSDLTSGQAAEDLALEIGKLNGGYALVATYAGRWLKGNTCDVLSVRDVIKNAKGKPKKFLKKYLEHTLLGSEIDKARLVILPLLVHVYLGEMPKELARMLPTRLSNGNPLSIESASWLAREHEDLLEEALMELGEHIVRGLVDEDAPNITALPMTRLTMEEVKEIVKQDLDVGEGIRDLNHIEILAVFIRDLMAETFEKSIDRLNKEQFECLLNLYSRALFRCSEPDFLNLMIEKAKTNGSWSVMAEYLYLDNNVPFPIMKALTGLPQRSIDGLPWKLSHEDCDIDYYEKKVDELYEMADLDGGHLESKELYRFISNAAGVAVLGENKKEFLVQTKWKDCLRKYVRGMSAILSKNRRHNASAFGLCEKLIGMTRATIETAALLFEITRGASEKWLILRLERSLVDLESGFKSNEGSLIYVILAWSDLFSLEKQELASQRVKYLLDYMRRQGSPYFYLANAWVLPTLACFLEPDRGLRMLRRAEEAIERIASVDPLVFKDYISIGTRLTDEEKVRKVFGRVILKMKANVKFARSRILPRIDYSNIEEAIRLARESAKLTEMTETSNINNILWHDSLEIVSKGPTEEALRELIRDWEQIRTQVFDIEFSVLYHYFSEAVIAEKVLSGKVEYQEKFENDWKEFQRGMNYFEDTSCLTYSILSMLDANYSSEMEKKLIESTSTKLMELDAMDERGQIKSWNDMSTETKGIFNSLALRSPSLNAAASEYIERGIVPNLLLLDIKQTLAFIIKTRLDNKAEAAKKVTEICADWALLERFDDTLSYLFIELGRTLDQGINSKEFRSAILRLFYYLD